MTNQGPKSLLTTSGVLLGAQLVGLGLAFMGYAGAARALGTEGFGKFVFFYSVLAYSAIFFDGGTSIAAGRLLALSSNQEEQRRLVGNWLRIFLLLGVFYVAVLLVVSVWIDRLFGFGVGTILAASAIPAVGIPWQNALREILQGLGARTALSILYVAPWAGFLCILATLWATGNASLENVALTLPLSFLITAVASSVSLKPRLDGPRLAQSPVWAETKRFGIHAFWGRLVGTGTYQIDTPLIAFFTRDPVAVGFYGLAKGLVAPIPLVTRSIGVATYRRLAVSARLPRRIVLSSTLGLLGLCLVAWMAAGPLVQWLLSQKYAGVLPLLYLWIGVALIQGSYQLPNVFLSARGEGRKLRTMAMWFALMNVILNFTLIPFLGALGATLASGGAFLVWLSLCIFYYNRVTRQAVSPTTPVQPLELQTSLQADDRQ